jgi:hypothetical protein
VTSGAPGNIYKVHRKTGQIVEMHYMGLKLNQRIGKQAIYLGILEVCSLPGGLGSRKSDTKNCEPFEKIPSNRARRAAARMVSGENTALNTKSGYLFGMAMRNELGASNNVWRIVVGNVKNTHGSGKMLKVSGRVLEPAKGGLMCVCTTPLGSVANF